MRAIYSLLLICSFVFIFASPVYLMLSVLGQKYLHNRKVWAVSIDVTVIVTLSHFNVFRISIYRKYSIHDISKTYPLTKV